MLGVPPAIEGALEVAAVGHVVVATGLAVGAMVVATGAAVGVLEAATGAPVGALVTATGAAVGAAVTATGAAVGALVTATGAAVGGDVRATGAGVGVEVVPFGAVNVTVGEMLTGPGPEVAQPKKMVTVPEEGMTSDAGAFTGERVPLQAPPTKAALEAWKMYSAPVVDDIEMVKVSPGI
jgi:hypothetical protein